MDFLIDNIALLAPLVIIQFLLIVIALIDLFKVERTNGPKWLWFLLIICISMMGPIAYFIFGRKVS